MEAAQELFEKKNNEDSFDAMEKVKKVFEKSWKEHDILKKGVIDFSEGYQLMQEISNSA